MPRDRLQVIGAAIQRSEIAWVRHYHRLDISGDLVRPEVPTLFVANHGFGGIFDLNVFAVLAAFEELALDRPVTILVHKIAWTLGVGRLLEAIGAVPASAEAARRALAQGNHVLVFPGGDLDAFKARRDCDKILFAGRSGFARLAIEAGVPIVPIATAGSGETLFVLSDGQWLARALRTDRLLRLKALPVTLSIPWGLNIGLVGLLPYLPVPAKLSSRVLRPMRPEAGETAAHFANRVSEVMQDALSELAVRRRASPPSATARH
ncbi:MAG: 1-acyl-sn-glycerol-3-phosphate acyltransferase [Nocardioides sp.]|uniref:1-acyl-sn-glycerol-3-phosphate acyltransferase n=1 Tax=Nocardioides sp. TaxID=35761 RepID=UPI0039E6D264